jgi:hypothetical protein
MEITRECGKLPARKSHRMHKERKQYPKKSCSITVYNYKEEPKSYPTENLKALVEVVSKTGFVFLFFLISTADRTFRA